MTRALGLYLGALALTPLMLVPTLALSFDLDFPFSGITMFPVWIVDSLAMIVHESGHTATQWIFGQPSGMEFMPEIGAARTYSAARQPWLLACIYAVFALVAGWLYAARKRRALAIFGALVALHMLLAATPAHRILTIYMGHGAEMLAGAAVAWRCLCAVEDPAAPRAARMADAAWRLAVATGGVYLVAENILRMARLMFGAPPPLIFQNGRRIYPDIALAANGMDISLAAAASVLFVAGVALLFLVGVAAARAGKA